MYWVRREDSAHQTRFWVTAATGGSCFNPLPKREGEGGKGEASAAHRRRGEAAPAPAPGERPLTLGGPRLSAPAPGEPPRLGSAGPGSGSSQPAAPRVAAPVPRSPYCGHGGAESCRRRSAPPAPTRLLGTAAKSQQRPASASGQPGDLKSQSAAPRPPRTCAPLSAR